MMLNAFMVQLIQLLYNELLYILVHQNSFLFREHPNVHIHPFRLLATLADLDNRHTHSLLHVVRSLQASNHTSWQQLISLQVL